MHVSQTKAQDEVWLTVDGLWEKVPANYPSHWTDEEIESRVYRLLEQSGAMVLRREVKVVLRRPIMTINQE